MGNFLGLNSINVIKDYIDNQIASYSNVGLHTITVYAYAYVLNENAVPSIYGGNYDSAISKVNYPEGWDSLNNVINSIKDEEGNIVDLDNALLDGAIWMSVGMINAENTLSSWSTPMKLSGQNGQPGQDGASFMFSYTIDGEYSSNILQLENTEGKDIIYFKYKSAGSENWSEPGIWAKYTNDGIDGVSGHTVLYRYGLSHIEDVDEEGNLIPPTQWVKNILNIGLSKECPYLWMKSLSVSANDVNSITDSDFAVVEPILFSAWGVDGNVPNYIMTIYKAGTDLENSPESTPGIVKPESPLIDDENTELTAFLTLNDDWSTIPTNDNTIWWQCAVHVNGQTNKVMNGTDENPFVITRYNTLTKEAVPGQYTQILYAWSSSELQPTFVDPGFNPFDPSFEYDEETGWKPEGWNESPELTIAEGPENSLWMITALADGVNAEHGYPMLKTSWSNPIKITGPRGPISYDYRMEIRYMNGNAELPRKMPNEIQWETDPKANSIILTSDYPYLWAKTYLVCYKMKYSDTPDADGTYPVVQVSEQPDKVIKEYSHYRISGLNGEDGSTKNNLLYSNNESEITISSFSTNNMFISNSDSETIYNINYSVIDFLSGYTGKFANIGSGNVKIKTSDPYSFINGNSEVTEFDLTTNESVDIVCYKDNDNSKKFLVIGKSL